MTPPMNCAQAEHFSDVTNLHQDHLGLNLTVAHHSKSHCNWIQKDVFARHQHVSFSCSFIILSVICDNDSKTKLMWPIFPPRSFSASPRWQYSLIRDPTSMLIMAFSWSCFFQSQVWGSLQLWALPPEANIEEVEMAVGNVLIVCLHQSSVVSRYKWPIACMQTNL